MINKKQLKEGITWNVVSFGIMGISGVLINAMIGYFYSASALGLFNLTWAIYIFFSQLGTFGLHYSTLKFISGEKKSTDESSAHATAGLLLVSVFALLASSVSLLIAPYFNQWFSSQKITFAWQLATPGLFLFCVNKVLLGIANGHLKMKLFAIGNSLRFIFLMSGILILILTGYSEDYLTVSLSFAEFFLFIFLLLGTFKKLNFNEIKDLNLFKSHLKFGAKSFPSGALVELNTRVDVLMIGYFTSEKLVGIYSMAATIAEGFSQLSVVFRNNFNPYISKLNSVSATDELEKFIKTNRNKLYKIMAPLALFAIAMFPVFIDFFVQNSTFHKGFLPFTILIISIYMASGYLPFNMVLLQSGFPGTHTYFQSIVVCSNLLLNLFLIPIWGILGGALATGASFVVMTFLLKAYVAKKLKIHI